MQAAKSADAGHAALPPLSTRPLSPALGLEVLGVDLREPIGAGAGRATGRRLAPRAW